MMPRSFSHRRTAGEVGVEGGEGDGIISERSENSRQLQLLQCKSTSAPTLGCEVFPGSEGIKCLYYFKDPCLKPKQKTPQLNKK